MRHHIRRGLTTTPATLIIAATSILCGGNIRFVSGRADTLRQVNASNDNILNIIDDSLAPTSDPLNLIEEENNVINNSSAPTTLSPVDSTDSPTTDSPVSNAPISEAPISPAPISPAPISPAPVTAYPTEPPIALTSPPTNEVSATTEQQFVASQVLASQVVSTKMVSFDPPWPRNTDWSNMGSPGECSIRDDGTATRIDEDDGGVLTILNGLMNTVIPSEGLLFRTPDYLNDEWVPGSHVNNLFRTSNPAYSLTYLPSSPANDCKLINGKDFVDWCQSDGLRPEPIPPGSCGGPGFCAEDFIGCPLTTETDVTCITDNNGGPLPDCSGKENRWDNAVVAGVYGSKYKANENNPLYDTTNPTDPVVTNVCYPTDANAIDFRIVDGIQGGGALSGNGGCRTIQDPVCGPDVNTCLSYEVNDCRCDYNGQFGGNGVSGLQAGQQIATYNNGICGQVTPPAIGAGNKQPSDYVDAAACWYDTSVPIAMNNLVSHSNTMWLRRDDWLNWVTPAKLPVGGFGEQSYHGWNECTVKIPGATLPNPSIREFDNMDALTIILPALTDPGNDVWSLCDLSFDALERLADTLDALWYRGYKDNQVPVVVMQQVQGKETDPNNDRFCKNYWDDTACTNGYRKTFFKQTIYFPIGDSCLLMDTDGEVYFKKDKVGFGTPCADNPLWVGTNKPSGAPSVSSKPSILPTDSPSESPSGQPSDPPTRSSQPTVSPSSNPTSTSDPTAKPSNSDPTESPTLSPTLAPTLSPTLSPTLAPTLSPTLEPTLAPTLIPTLLPTLRPTLLPTLTPSREPTLFPTLGPTELPTLTPTDTVPIPTLSPTFAPSFSPTRIGGLPPRPTTGPPFAKPPKPDDVWGNPPPVDWGGSVPKPPKPAPIDDWGGSGGDTSSDNDAWNQPPPPPDLKPIFGWGTWGKAAKSKSSKSSKSQWGKSGKSGGWMDYDGQGIHYYGKSSKKGEGSSKYSNYNYANQVDGYTIAQPNKADRRIQSVLCLSVVTLVMTALLI